MSFTVENVINDIEKQIGDAPFVPASLLIELGLFPNQLSLKMAIRSGILPAVKTGKRRFAIPRGGISSYLRNNFYKIPE